MEKIKVYLDHNIVDGFDKGKTAYIEPLMANNRFLLIISLASIDEIFRGGDQNRARRNIDSLKKLGVNYIYSGHQETHMFISELDYENLHQKWVEMHSNVRPLHDAHNRLINTLFRDDVPSAIKDMDQALTDLDSWHKNNDYKYPNLQPQLDNILRDSEKDKELLRPLVNLKNRLPFKAKEINNIPVKDVFWVCIEKLKGATDQNLHVLGNFIENEIDIANTIDEQVEIVFFWLNFFSYYSDDLTKIERVRSNCSDANHAAYGIACDAILTLDKKFAKRAAATMCALKLKTEVGTDANELLHRITKKTDFQ